MQRKTSGNRGEDRASALWGSGNRGGELRSNALWGKGGKGVLVAVATVALAVPFTAGAGGAGGAKGPKGGPNVVVGGYVSQQLKEKGRSNPNQLVRVIIQSDAGYVGAENAAKRALAKLDRKFEFLGAVSAELRAKDIAKLERAGIIVTEDVPIKPLGIVPAYASTQLWTHESGVNKLWNGPQAPAIAIVDSGIDENHPVFGTSARVIDRQVFVTNQSGGHDSRGHGTFVAGIAAGSALGYAGAAPNAPLIDLDVMDDNGMGRTSDVIAAAEWIFLNHEAKNIRVANFSLHSGSVQHFWLDPLNKAVEKLWFAGVTVVAAAGNYGTAGAASGVKYAPGSDPFVVTVGAMDIGGTAKVGDDARAPFSAYGRTPDGFWKPEICAPGRYMVGPIPMSSTLATLKADKIRAAGYIELSGTSFAAPVISGIAAQILARNPGFTPDQVKGALMRRARPVPQAAPLSCGVGQVNAPKTATYVGTATPNKALNAFVTTDPATGRPVFNSVSWTDVSWTDVSWDSVSWTDVSWTDVSWDSVSWTDVSWTDVSWTDVSWTDVSWEDAAETEFLDGDGFELTPAEELAATLDPDLAVAFDPGLAPGALLDTVATTP